MPVPAVRRWESEFLAFLEAQHPKVLEGIRTRKALDDTNTNALKAAIDVFKKLFTVD